MIIRTLTSGSLHNPLNNLGRDQLIEDFLIGQFIIRLVPVFFAFFVVTLHTAAPLDRFGLGTTYNGPWTMEGGQPTYPALLGGPQSYEVSYVVS